MAHTHEPAAGPSLPLGSLPSPPPAPWLALAAVAVPAVRAYAHRAAGRIIDDLNAY